MFEKQPNLSTKYPEKQPRYVKDVFGNFVETYPEDPFAEEVPLKTAVEIPLTFLGNPQELSTNPNHLLQEPLVQQQTVTANDTPRPNLPEKDTSKKNAWGPFQTSSAPVWKYYPRRPGPLLYWQKDRSELTPEEIWYRENPMSPAFNADPVDNRRHKEEPRKPSHGRSEPWYVESD